MDRGHKKSFVYSVRCGILPCGSDCGQCKWDRPTGPSGLYADSGGNNNVMRIQTKGFFKSAVSGMERDFFYVKAAGIFLDSA
mgnify:CR=1 FL=1